MSIYDKASLVMIPSGYKASSATLYSVVPNTSVGDFDVTVDADATRVNKDGLIESVAANQARLDYPLTDGVVGDCPHLLLEPSRTNIQGYSESFSNWSTSNLTTLDNQAISPDGNITADSIKETSATSGKFIYLDESVTSGNDYTYSVFVKYNGTRYVQLTGSTGFGTGHVNFDLENGTITLESSILDASITKYPNDWFRISVKLSCTTTTTTGRFLIALINSANAGRVASYAGDTSKGVYLWGAQFEISDYPTSYIPNILSGSTTRTADVCNGAGDSSTFNDSEGVLFTEVAALANDGTTREMALSDGGASNRIELRYISSANVIQTVIRGAASTIVLSYTLSDATEFAKVAVKYKSGDYALWIGGVERATSTTTGTPTGFSEFAFDDGNGNFNIYAKIKQAMIFNTALTDSELQTLTS